MTGCGCVLLRVENPGLLLIASAGGFLCLHHIVVADLPRRCSVAPCGRRITEQSRFIAGSWCVNPFSHQRGTRNPDFHRDRSSMIRAATVRELKTKIINVTTFNASGTSPRNYNNVIMYVSDSQYDTAHFRTYRRM